MRKYQIGDQIDFHDGVDDVTATITGTHPPEEGENPIYTVFCHQHGTHRVTHDAILELEERDIRALTPDSIRLLRSETHAGSHVAVRMLNGETVRGSLIRWCEKDIAVETRSGTSTRDIRYVTGVYLLVDAHGANGGTL